MRKALTTLLAPRPPPNRAAHPLLSSRPEAGRAAVAPTAMPAKNLPHAYQLAACGSHQGRQDKPTHLQKSGMACRCEAIVQMAFRLQKLRIAFALRLLRSILFLPSKVFGSGRYWSSPVITHPFGAGLCSEPAICRTQTCLLKRESPV